MPTKGNVGVDSSHASDLVVKRGGARDNGSPGPDQPLREHPVTREGLGSVEISPPIEPEDFSIPEGLRRERKGPYSPTRGRGEVPEHVPGGKKVQPNR